MSFTRITKGGITTYEMSKSNGTQIRRVLAMLWKSGADRDKTHIATPNGIFTLNELNRYLYG